ncbi:MAG: DsbA family protein [Alphaproteobacteria bacterium]|nr:DsbA family protein [Alphaproteobacteria bacterium]
MPTHQSNNIAPRASGGRHGLTLIIPFLLLAGLVLAGLMFFFNKKQAPTVYAADGTATAGSGVGRFSASDRSDIEKIVKDYLLNNPDILLEVQTALEVKMEKEQAEKTKAAIAKNAKEIYRNPNAPLGGNPDGDITVVEFFDYNCGYCKRGFSDIAKLIKADPNVRVVFKEYPILSADSEKAARVALAARQQGKYWDVHQKLITSRGRVTEDSALKAAEEAGADMTKLKEDLKSDAVNNEIERVKTLAKDMGINGTPHFLVGDKSIGGAPQDLFDQLSAHIKQLRKDGCAYC